MEVDLRRGSPHLPHISPTSSISPPHLPHISSSGARPRPRRVPRLLLRQPHWRGTCARSSLRRLGAASEPSPCRHVLGVRARAVRKGARPHAPDLHTPRPDAWRCPGAAQGGARLSSSGLCLQVALTIPMEVVVARGGLHHERRELSFGTLTSRSSPATLPVTVTSYTEARREDPRLPEIAPRRPSSCAAISVQLEPYLGHISGSPSPSPPRPLRRRSSSQRSSSSSRRAWRAPSSSSRTTAGWVGSCTLPYRAPSPRSSARQPRSREIEIARDRTAATTQ